MTLSLHSSLQVQWSFRWSVTTQVNRTRGPAKLRPQRSQTYIQMTLSNRHSPDLQLYTNNLPRCHRNHLPGYQTTLQVICPSLDEAQILPPNASDSWPSWCRWGSNQVAMYVSEAVASSTSKEAHDHRTYRQHGALTAYLPEVPCSPQPHHDGRSFTAVRGASASPTKSNH